MIITTFNFDDIIRAKKRELYEQGKSIIGLEMHWGLDGYQAMYKVYGNKVQNGFRLFNVKHYFDLNK